jgi:hypothetical protein
MIRSLIPLFFVTFLWHSSLFFGAELGPDEKPRSQFTATELRGELLKSQDRIKSIRVSYRSEYYTDPKAPRNTYLYRVLAAKGPCSLYHLSAHPGAEFDWNEDPNLQVSYVQDTTSTTVFPFVNSYFVTALTPESQLPGTLPREFFLQATGIWPITLREAPRWEEAGIPVALRDVAKSANYSVVRPFQEKVGGHWCHVLDWLGHDSLWIDVKRGCVLLAREAFIPSNGARVLRYELSEHRECVPGLWLPMKLHNIQFDYCATTQEGRGRKVIDGYLTVESLEVNDVADSLFDFKPSPGALLLSDSRSPGGKSPLQTAPGGLDILDRLAGWIRAHMRRDNSIRSTAYSWCVGLGPVLVIVLLEVWRRTKCRGQ